MSTPESISTSGLKSESEIKEETKPTSIIIETPIRASGRKISLEVEPNAKQMLERLNRKKEIREIREKEIEEIKEKKKQGKLLSAKEIVILRETPLTPEPTPEPTPPTAEQSQTPEGRLYKARKDLARVLSEAEAEQGRSWIKNMMGTSRDELRITSSPEYIAHIQALREYRQELLAQTQTEGLKGKALEKRKKEILLLTSAEEANLLYDAKTELKVENTPQKIARILKKIGQVYSKIPFKYKVLPFLGVTAITMGVGAGMIATGGTLATIALPALLAGTLGQRVLGGTAIGVLVEGSAQKSQKYKETKEVTEEVMEKFGNDILKALDDDDEVLNRKILDIEKKKKAKGFRRAMYGMIAGTIIAGGFIGKAIEMFSGGEVPPLGEGEVPPPVEVTVQPGNTVWGIVENQFQEGDYQEYLSKLTGDPETVSAKTDYLVDAIKDKIAENPSKFGIPSGSIDNIFSGDKLDLTSIFQNKDFLNRVIEKANALSPESLENISHYGARAITSAGDTILTQFAEGHAPGLGDTIPTQFAEGHIPGLGDTIPTQFAEGHIPGLGDTIPTQIAEGHIPGPEDTIPTQIAEGHIPGPEDTIPTQIAEGHIPGPGDTIEATSAVELLTPEAVDQAVEEIGKEIEGQSKILWILGNKGDFDFYKGSLVQSLIEWAQGIDTPGAENLEWHGTMDGAEGKFRKKLAERLLQYQDSGISLKGKTVLQVIQEFVTKPK